MTQPGAGRSSPPPAFVLAWARSPIAPIGGALSALAPHELGAPVLHSLLQSAGLPAQAVDAVVLGNALSAGGNPARMLALAAGLPERCAAHTVDTQCCSGLDAVSLAVGLLQSGQAQVVVAGGVEAWSRAPIRQTRPRNAREAPQAYERPPFAPDPARDPDLLQSAADYAFTHGFTRASQENYALQSHARALAARATLAHEIVPIAGLAHDAYPRLLNAQRAARMPVVAMATASLRQMPSTEAAPNNGEEDADACALSALSALTISAKADGAALVLLATPEACQRWNLQPCVQWIASASIGCAPETPLLAAALATRKVLARGAQALQQPALAPAELAAIELHDAFAVQALVFCQDLQLPPDAINRQGGGLARGHPIGASGAVALVRALAQLQALAQSQPKNLLGLATVAGAGGIGAACLVQWLNHGPRSPVANP